MTNRAKAVDIIWGISWVVLAILSYQVLNRTGRDVLIDISTDFDRAMPLVPAFVVPYLSFIPLVFIVVPALALRSGLIFRTYTLSIFVTQMILNVLYVVVPATVVRPNIESNDIFSTLLRDFVWRLDEPVNTFPSNHVALSTLAIFTLATLQLRRWWVLPLQLWLGVICISTLFVYQHVLLDLVAGATIGAAVYLAISKTLLKRIKPQSRVRKL